MKAQNVEKYMETRRKDVNLLVIDVSEGFAPEIESGADFLARVGNELVRLSALLHNDAEKAIDDVVMGSDTITVVGSY